MKRCLISSGVIIVTACVLAACGQSGALMLPSDPNYDKRPQYLFYKNKKSAQKEQDANLITSGDVASQP